MHLLMFSETYRIKDSYAGMEDMIPIHLTYIHPDASEIIAKVLSSTFISEGEVVKSFEGQLEEQLRLRYCVTVNSGTAALHLALSLAGVSEGDEVILPAQTFVATGLVILQQRARPVFADIDYATGNIDVASIRKKITRKTKAIMPVHWGGYPCDMDEINAIAREHQLVVIEDAAHALGATYKNSPVGNLSDYTCFSFQAIKHLTTGDGGAVCTKPDKYRQAMARRWFGIDRINSTMSELGERTYNLDELGYKYHLNNYAAALGIANLRNLKARLAQRREVAKYYRSELDGLEGLKLFNNKADRESSYWLFGIHVQQRNNFVRSLKARGVTASVVHQRIDRNAIFGGTNRDLVQQEEFDQTQIHIPIHDDINLDKAKYIIDAIKQGW